MNSKVLGLLLAATFASQADAAILCKADLSPLKEGAIVTVQIDDETQPKVNGIFDIAGQKSEIKDAPVLDFPVRHDIDYSKVNDVIKLNPGEQRLALIQTVLNDADMKATLNLDKPLNVKDVATVRIYDLNHDALENMFGGSPLIDLLDANGQLIVRLQQGIMITACK